jgi:predicted RNase H-like HicB family nuclease
VEVSVILEQVENNGYRARCGDPFVASADGSTREEALARLRGVLTEKIAAGIEVVRLEVPMPRRKGPIWPDDQITRDWLEGIAEARKKADSETYPWEKDIGEQP